VFFIFDALVACEVLVYVGLGCGVEVRQLLSPEGESPPVADVVVAWSPPGEGGCGGSRWVSKPMHFKEGLNQEYRDELDLGDFVRGGEDPGGGQRARLRSQGFCIELRAVKSGQDSRRESSFSDLSLAAGQNSGTESEELSA
ncbi:unnamed protein product, partial [Polarella glacialis]